MTKNSVKLMVLIIIDGPMVGLYARGIVVIDENGTVIYTELVPEHIQEPNYEAALKAVQ